MAGGQLVCTVVCLRKHLPPLPRIPGDIPGMGVQRALFTQAPFPLAWELRDVVPAVAPAGLSSEGCRASQGAKRSLSWSSQGLMVSSCGEDIAEHASRASPCRRVLLDPLTLVWSFDSCSLFTFHVCFWFCALFCLPFLLLPALSQAAVLQPPSLAGKGL